jgi:hypothetical protein
MTWSGEERRQSNKYCESHITLCESIATIKQKFITLEDKIAEIHDDLKNNHDNSSKWRMALVSVILPFLIGIMSLAVSYGQLQSKVAGIEKNVVKEIAR